MNTNKTFAGIVFVAFLLSACNLPSPYEPEIPNTGSGPVGKISAEKTLVESGPSDHLAQVTNTADFFDNDTVRVTNGGAATLDLLTGQVDNHILIRIFNDTMVGDVKADPSGTTNPLVTILLVFGGLTGEVPKNGGAPVQFTTPNGVNIYILGTQFLVVYDPATSTTYIGNFDGFIEYSTPGQSGPVDPGQLFEISPSFEIEKMALNLTRTEIEDLTSKSSSTLLATLKDYIATIVTPTPTTIPTPFPTITPTPTTIPTSFPTSTPPLAQASLCDKAAFVADVTIPDGTSFSAGAQFTKVWRLRNVGTCTWTSSYSVVFYKGEQMAGKSVNIPSTVAPGQTVDISVNLIAPGLLGSYRSEWILRNPSGALFGGGAKGTNPLWVVINVISTPTPTQTVISLGGITGTAFSDNNGNGVPDTGEVVQGLAVTLYDSSYTGTIPQRNTTTDANGKYTFADLSPGSYYVKWVVSGCNGSETRQALVNVTSGAPQIQPLSTFVLC